MSEIPDFEKIVLGHGSGGLLTNDLLDKGVFKLLANEILDEHHDGAVLNLKGSTAFSTDSFVVSPIEFPGGNIGDLAVNGTVNDLAMCGAVPEYLSLGFILEEGLSAREFWAVLQSIRKACDKAGVKIVTGDTKVVERGKGDKVFVNTTGLGRVLSKAKIGIKYIKPGDAVILSGSMANHGMAIMSVREGLEFESEIRSDTRPLHQPVQQLIEQHGEKIKLLRDPTRGGVATVLTEIAQVAELGITLEQDSLPVRPQVESACEILGLDPIYVANEGIFVCIADKTVADQIVNTLRKFDFAAEAVVIGQVTEEHKGRVVMNTTIGGRRVVNMLAGEQLPRIC